MSKKSFKDYFNVAQLGNHGPDYADDNPGKLNARVARYRKQEFYRKFPPIYLGKRCGIVFNDKDLEQHHI